jgi:hypothetical protein
VNGGLLDIRPPPAAAEGVSLLLAGTLLLLLLALFLLLRHHGSPQRRAWRRLRRLRQALRDDQLECRQAAHALAEIVARGAAGKKGKPTALAGDGCAAQQRQQVFSLRLTEARFAAKPCSRGQLNSLLDEAEYWLRRQR